MMLFHIELTVLSDLSDLLLDLFDPYTLGCFSGLCVLWLITFLRSLRNRVDGLYYVYIKNATKDSVGVTGHSRLKSKGDLVIPELVMFRGKKCSVIAIGERAFEGCKGLESVMIPNSMISIGDHAFRNCRGLKKVVIPDNVTIIGNCAFLECSSLKKVVIPNNVTVIGDRAFKKCTNLTELVLPNSLESIGQGAFEGCSNLRKIRGGDRFRETAVEWLDDDVRRQVMWI